MIRSANTPLGLWQFAPDEGIHILDTAGDRGRWRPLVVSIALTRLCHKECAFCYASAGSGRDGGDSLWPYDDLITLIADLDKNGVFCITLGGGEPTLWQDPSTSRTFYDLVDEIHHRFSVAVTFTSSGSAAVAYDRLPYIPVRLSCHEPGEVEGVLRSARQMRERARCVGINLLLWRTRLDECRLAVRRLVNAGFHDILLLTLKNVGRGAAHHSERVDPEELARWLRTLDLDFVRLASCDPVPAMMSSDMGCGSGDWFLSISEQRVVKSCSFVDAGHPLHELSYEGLVRASLNLPRMTCYRPFTDSPLIKQPWHGPAGTRV